MRDCRLARGCRFLGYCRLRQFVFAGLALVLVAVPIGSASARSKATSGGVGVLTGSPHKRKQPAATARRAQVNPLAVRGIWIWVVADSSGGSLSAIISRAHQYGIGTVIIKSGDGTRTWSQFSAPLVSRLHAAGLRVCGWQFVYGNNPLGEAQVGAATVKARADCLVIDAESDYEGKYIQAQTYIAQLRKRIGANFPVALAGFPYIDFHPAFPYSIFLGPGGAQYNTPQMYWRDIGTTVDTVYSHTYAYNRLYQRRIYPLGQIYNAPPPGQVIRFRQVARAYGAPNVSWWDWQEGTQAAWSAMARSARSLSGYVASPLVATINSSSAGDLVVWAQEHLISAGYPITVDGGYGASTVAAVESFQAAHGLTVDGVIGPQTWSGLLRYAPANVRWTTAGAKLAAAARFSLTMPVPRSARLHAKRDELAGPSGAGMPPRR